jgi:hypothetical protein
MDQPTPDQPTPDDPPAPTTAPETIRVPLSKRDEHVTQRLQSLVGANAVIVAWARGWVSREIPAHRLFAARTLDFAVLTETDLFLYSSGFFTRRARRLVYAADLDHVGVADQRVRHGRRLLVKADNGRALRLELRASARASHFADELIASAVGQSR